MNHIDIKSMKLHSKYTDQPSLGQFSRWLGGGCWWLRGKGGFMGSVEKWLYKKELRLYGEMILG